MDFSLDRTPKLGPKTKIASAVAVSVLVLLLVLEMTLLRGRQVASLTVGLGATETGAFTVHDVGEAHLVEVRTTRRRRGETEGRRVKMRLEDPNGAVVYEAGEWANRKVRYFSFTPRALGTHTLFVEPEMLAGSSRGNARVKVTVGDRRVLTRMFAAIP